MPAAWRPLTRREARRDETRDQMVVMARSCVSSQASSGREGRRRAGENASFGCCFACARVTLDIISAATTEKVVGCAVARIAKFVGSISKNSLPRLDVKSIVHVTVDASATVIPTHNDAATPNVSPDFKTVSPEGVVSSLSRVVPIFCRLNMMG